MNTSKREFGGITRGLYGTFDTVGLLFFTFLIGRTRAARPILETSRVLVGATLTFVVADVALIYLGHPLMPREMLQSAEEWFVWLAGQSSGRLVGRCVESIVAGLAGFVLALILLLYVSGIDREVETERQQLRREQHRAERERQQKEKETQQQQQEDELVAQGVPRDEARRRVRGSCLIASCVFESDAAREVRILQYWRDRALLTSALGGRAVRFYYRFAPYCIPLLERNALLKAMTRWLVSGIVEIVDSQDTN